MGRIEGEDGQNQTAVRYEDLLTGRHRSGKIGVGTRQLGFIALVVVVTGQDNGFPLGEFNFGLAVTKEAGANLRALGIEQDGWSKKGWRTKSVRHKIFEEYKQTNVPMLRDFFLATFLRRSKTAPWPAWSPWLKLKRATFIPASISFSKPSSDQQAGPRVQTILVRRLPTDVLALTISRVIKPPRKVGTFPVLATLMVEFAVFFLFFF